MNTLGVRDQINSGSKGSLLADAKKLNKKVFASTILSNTPTA